MKVKPIMVCIILILSSTGAGILNITTMTEAAYDTDGVLTVDTKLVASGTYDQIRIESTGHLIVETTLEASTVILESGSELEIISGTLKLFDSDTEGAKVSLTGTCDNFKMTSNAKLLIEAPTGESTVGVSRGGDGELNIKITKNIIIDSSQIIVIGGNGYSKPTPKAATNRSLGDFQYAGGNATVYFELPKTCKKKLVDSSISLMGGSGGKAADGENAPTTAGGKGGGYSNGGDVFGNVGQGGFAKLKFQTDESFSMAGMNITIIGGGGGRPGQGNSTMLEHGGGGGGYSGGDGGYRIVSKPELARGKSGGSVSGYVGSGGNASFIINSESSVEFENNRVDVRGGIGGDAGPHSELSNYGYLGGCGGGGYGGGGGGAGYATTIGSHTSYGGDGGDLSGFVGSGGSAFIDFNIKENINCDSSELDVTGGRGGNAGAGTRGVKGGGGGGGYGGGGGGGGSLLDTCDVKGYGGAGGSLSDYVASGGDSFVLFNSSNRIQITNSKVTCTGGNGGSAGSGGEVNGTDAGSGGGGYGGGGGGGKNGVGKGGPGGSGSSIGGYVGAGGSADLRFISSAKIEIIDSKLVGSGGSGGAPAKGGVYKSGKGGAGGGGYCGGGGGGSSASSTGGAGGTGTINSSNVASGGSAYINLDAKVYSISKSSDLEAEGGSGGYSNKQPGGSGGTTSSGYGAGGCGYGHAGASGSHTLTIPMGTPGLLNPYNDKPIKNPLPEFQWVPQHNSTSHGSLTGHRLEVDEQPNFKSPVVIAYSKSGSYEIQNPLGDGKYYWHVRAEYGANTPGWSETRSFTIDNTTVFFNDLLPSDWCSELEPNCSVEVGDEHTAVNSSSIQFSISITDTMPESFTSWLDAEGVIDLTGDGKTIKAWTAPRFIEGESNFIKWRAMDIVGNGYNESPILTVKIDTEAPIVTAFEPQNGSWLGNTSPTLKFTGFDSGSGLSGNCSVKIYEYENNSMSELVSEYNGTVLMNETNVFSIEPEEELDDGSFCWFASVSDNAGLWSTCSDIMVMHIDTVQPVVIGEYPDRNQWTDSRPEFIWQVFDTFAGVSGDFVIELAHDASFNKLIYRQEGSYSDLTGHFGQTYKYKWPAEIKLEERTWFWRIKVLGNEDLWSDYSQPKKFQVDDSQPVLVPIFPLNGSWSDGQLSLSFSVEDDGSGVSGMYHVQISEDIDFLKPVIDEAIELYPITIEDTNNNSRDSDDTANNNQVNYQVSYKLKKPVYYWRVSAQDNVGLWSVFSTPREVRVDVQPPSVLLAEPAFGQWVGADLNFIWSAEDSYSGLSGEYRIQVSPDIGFEELFINATVSGPRENNVEINHEPQTILPEGNLYFRVSARDNAGNWCPFAVYNSFKLDLTGISFKRISEEIWYTGETVSFEIGLSDFGSGVDTDEIYYRTTSTGVSTYGLWKKVEFEQITQQFPDGIKCEVEVECEEGLGNLIQFKAKDNVNSEYQESPNYRINVDRSSVIFSEPQPRAGLWHDSTVVSCSISIFDLYSGVNANTIEYRYKTAYEEQFSDWIPYDLSYQQLASGEIVCTISLTFRSGEDNYIQWRAEDNAGFGYLESEEYQIKIRLFTEGEHSEQVDPNFDEDTKSNWDWIKSSDGIFILRLFSILIVFFILIGFLRRHSQQTYGVNKRRQKKRSSGFKDVFGRRRVSSKPGFERGELEEFDEIDEQGDLEEIMAALDKELKGQFAASNGLKGEINEPRIHTISSGPSTTKKYTSKGILSKEAKKITKRRECYICLGEIKRGTFYKKCKCGQIFHTRCSKRRTTCPDCGKKL